MPASKQAVVQVGHCQHDGSGDREYPVRDDAELLVRDGRADDEEQQSGAGGPCDAEVTVPGDAQANGNDTERQDQHQHLGMQVALHEGQQDRQCACNEWQRKAMQQAQSGEADSGAVEPIGRFGGCLIHAGMPLCFGDRTGAERRITREMIYYNNISLKSL